MVHNSDPPVHTRLRNLISRIFVPRNVASLREGLTSAARQIVTLATDKGDGDFV
jgi:cholest-4-en-3-one 26-monooxygenase